MSLFKAFRLSKRDIFLLVIITVIGGLIRFAGIRWGYYACMNPDEKKILDPAVEMALSGHYISDSFGYPGQFISKIVAFFWHNMTDTSFMSDAPVAELNRYFAYRGVMALFGTLTIVSAFLTGNFIKKGLGVVFGAMVALYPKFILMSIQITDDASGLFFSSLVVIFSLFYIKHYEEKEKSHIGCIIAMSVSAAMATMEKWHCATACFYIGFVILVMAVRKKKYASMLISWIGAAAIYVAGLAAIAPNTIKDPAGAFSGIGYMYGYDDISEKASFIGNVIRYTGYYGLSAGIFTILLMAAGIVYIKKNLSPYYLCIMIGVFKLIGISFLNRGFPRWGLEFYYSLIFITALGFLTVYEDYLKDKSIVRMLSLTGCAMVFVSLALMVCMCASLGKQYNRYRQVEFCKENGISEKNAVFEYYTGFRPGGFSIRESEGKWKQLLESIWERSGDLHRSEDYTYAIDAIDLDDTRTTRFLPEQCPVVARFDTVCRDVFKDPVYDIGFFPIDHVKAIKGLYTCAKMAAGGGIGHTIVIYDISGLPLDPWPTD